MHMDINVAIEAYSQAFGNRLGSLRQRCREESYDGPVEPMAGRIDRMQQAIFDIVRERSNKGALAMEEIETIARHYLSVKEPEVDEAGIQGILRWVVWMAWHEGYLRLPGQ